LFGYTAYSASKFALRGLAEALQMEVKPYNIHICMSFPPDTVTPGFEEEMKTKPEETKLISESSGLWQADVIAAGIVEDVTYGKFLSSVGVDGWLLTNLTCGMGPFDSCLQVIQQVVTMGLFRAISVLFLIKFDKIVARCHKQRVNKSTDPLIDKNQ